MFVCFFFFLRIFKKIKYKKNLKNLSLDMNIFSNIIRTNYLLNHRLLIPYPLLLPEIVGEQIDSNFSKSSMLCNIYFLVYSFKWMNFYIMERKKILQNPHFLKPFVLFTSFFFCSKSSPLKHSNRF